MRDWGALWVPSCTTCCLTTLVMHERDLCVCGGKVMGCNFAEAPDGGVFGSEALQRDWCMTELATLTRILTLTA